MKRIVFLHTDLRLYWSARLNHFYDFLKNKGYELRVIEISGHGGNYHFEKRELDLEYWECLYPDTPMNELNPADIRILLDRKLRELQPEILVTGAIAFPSGANGVYFAARYRIPLIVFDDARLEDIPRSFLVNLIKRQLYSLVDAIVCPAPDWENTFKFFGLKGEQLFYGVDVVDNSFFNREFTSDGEMTCQERDYFLNVGRHIQKKNLLLLLKAYFLLHQKYPNVPDLVMVGDGESRQELEAFVKEKDLKTVYFFPFQSQQELKEVYQNAALFILPSDGETWGLVVNEAMASGLPVIVSNKVGCASTLVQDGENGYVFNRASESELLEKLEKFYFLSAEEKLRMQLVSLQTIADWDLNKFSTGFYQAIQKVESIPKKTVGIFPFILSKLWKGRYRPE